MSRLRKYVHSLSSGYLLLVGNIFSTLVVVPLTLHYLGTEQFALWALVLQVTGYLQLIDFGITSSLSRILIDHKDAPDTGKYGSAITSGVQILAIQGLLIAAIGFGLGYWLPSAMQIPSGYWSDLRWLIVGQCVVVGGTFAGRILTLILQAHQRTDIGNYAALIGMAMNLAVLWVYLAKGFGLWAMLIASAVGACSSLAASAAGVLKLRLLPQRDQWRGHDSAVFREVVTYASDVFLLSVGHMLINASQLPIITRVLGLEAAAVWSIATKAFGLVQQAVFRVFDFSSSALAEMIVRYERPRLLLRFRQIVVVTAVFATFVGVAVGLCNQAFLAVWVGERVTWPRINDAMMALTVAIYAVARTHIGLAGLTKRIGRMRWIYFLEGLAFVGIAIPATHHWGLGGLIVSAAVTSASFGGTYGIVRTADYLGLRKGEVAWEWVSRALLVFLLTGAVAVVIASFTTELPPKMRLGAEAIAFVLIGGPIAWFAGFPSTIRAELTRPFARTGKSSD